MRKLFLFTAAVLAMGSSQVQATDYITNGSFESTIGTQLFEWTYGNGGIEQPEGWLVEYLTSAGESKVSDPDYWTQAYTTSGQTKGTIETDGSTKAPSDITLGTQTPAIAPNGSKFYYARSRWSAEQIRMSQDVFLQPGQYVFSCVAACPDPYPTYLALVSGTDTIAKFDLSATEWTRFSYQFDLTEAKTAKVVLLMNHSNTTAQHRLFVDNIVLSDDAKELYKEQLSTLSQTVLNVSSTTDTYPSGYINKLDEMRASAENLLSSSTVTLEELKTSYEQMDSVYKEALTSAEVYTKLSDLDNKAYEEWFVTGTYKTGVVALEIAETAANAVLTGENSFKSDFEQAIIDLTAAFRAYNLSEVNLATKTDPIDLTWLINAPTFTKDGGDVATSADRVQGAWVNGNNITSSSGSDVRLNTVTGYNCWNSWASDWKGTMDLYQDLVDIPAGLYTVSAKHVSNGNASTTTHVYATSLAGTAVSPICNNIYEGTGTFGTDAEWVNYQTDTILVASDGALRIGMTSTGEGTKAGWFCVTDFQLNYYGAGAMLDEYKKSLATKIAEAETLATKEMLVSETTAIASAIATAKKADASNVEAIEATLATLNIAIAEADTAALAMTTFKAGAYATLAAQAEDDNRSGGLPNFITEQLTAADAALTATDATPEVYTSLGKELAIAVSYGKAQIAATVAAGLNEPVASLLMDIQDHYDELAAAAADTISLKKYITELTAYVTFGTSYTTNIALANDIATYGDAACTTFSDAMETILANLVSKMDASELPAATKEMQAAVGALKATGVQPGDEITARWVVNPEVTATGNSVAVDGWSVSHGGTGNTFTATGQHWTGDGTRRYFDSWNANAGTLQYIAKQSINGLANGTYKLQCAARSSGAGAYFYALSGTDTLKVEIPNNADIGGNIFDTAEEGSPEKLVHSTTVTVDGVTSTVYVGYGWNWIEITNINVGANELVFGVTTKNNFTHAIWDGNWFSATDFKLFYTNDQFTQTGGVSIDEVSADASTALNVYVENGYVVVPGVDNFQVTTITGAQVNSKAQLTPGIYVVKAAGKVAKVAVK